MTTSDASAAPTGGVRQPTLAEATRIWWRIGWLSFGGPTAQIALMHRMLVHELAWLGEPEFLDALGFCMLLPGPEAMQLATYSGWKFHGPRGGLVAGSLFVLPGALVVGSLAAIYAAFGRVPLVLAAFHGIQASVLVLVIEALVRIGRRALTRARQLLIAAAAFVAIYAFDIPFPLIVFAAAFLGWAGHADRVPPSAPPPAASISRAVRTAALWIAVWLLPLVGVVLAFGPTHVLSQLAWFFSRLAVVTFGGAYAALAYMSQDVVTHHAWLGAREMLDGLGLAETTPGPLILVTEFVGFLAAHHASPAAPFLYGCLGAAVALWATFVPCFLWVLTGAPFIASLRAQPRLQGALAAITAAVLGVILNLAVWFGLRVLFAVVTTVHAGPAHVGVPVPSTLDVRMLALAGLSALLLVRFRWSIHRVLAATASVSLLLRLLGR